MGFLGLFIGPVLMALIVSIWREWIREVKLAEPLEVPPPGLPGGDPGLAADMPVVRKAASP
jgi:hypothetical protein